jgi:hypothetical protein
MERSYLLPDGSVGTNDVAVPGRSAHHPGVTLGGVIYGDRDNSTVSAPRGIKLFSGGRSGRCRLPGQISPRASPSRTASALELTSSLR